MRSRSTSLDVTNVTGEKIQTTFVRYPTVDDVLGVLARAVAREKARGAVAYTAPSEEARHSLFRFE